MCKGSKSAFLFLHIIVSNEIGGWVQQSGPCKIIVGFKLWNEWYMDSKDAEKILLV